MTEPTKPENKKPDENLMEFSDSYTIHPSHHTGLVMVSKTLDGNNYGQWSRAIRMGLSAKNKIGFIDGTIKAPSPLDAKYAAWKRCNDMVTLWIVNSVHSHIAGSIMYTKTATAVWNDLRDRLSQSLKGVAEQEEKERAMHFLMGLNNSYATVRGSILMMSPLPDTRRVHGLILQHERQMDVANRRDMGTNSHTMQVQRTDASSSHSKTFNTFSRKSLKCTYCDGDGHLVDRCYYIIGFPEGHKWHGKNVKPKNKRTSNNAKVINPATTTKTKASDGLTFTTDEYNQIIAMLRNSNGQPLANATCIFLPKCNIA
ncbi:uncharacterized protein [Pyrus communis]|uniref:uncharacterized protein n=1 Tax=Pyrus communis TaxID=23211 RepID=UPI0035C0CC6B